MERQWEGRVTLGLLSLRRRFLRSVIPQAYWPEAVVIDGVEVAVRAAPYSVGVKRMLVRGTYEAPERSLVRRAIRSGDVVVEFGGSIGILAAVMSEIVGPKGQVVSIEASERLCSYSRTWLAPNVNVIAGFGFPLEQVPTGMRVNAFCDDRGSLGGRLAYDLGGDPETPDSDIWDVGRVAVATGVEPTVLVVDIEGSELTLGDARASIRPQIRELIIELHPHLYPRGSSDQRRIQQRIEGFGFELRDQIESSFWYSRATSSSPSPLGPPA